MFDRNYEEALYNQHKAWEREQDFYAGEFEKAQGGAGMNKPAVLTNLQPDGLIDYSARMNYWSSMKDQRDDTFKKTVREVYEWQHEKCPHKHVWHTTSGDIQIESKLKGECQFCWAELLKEVTA